MPTDPHHPYVDAPHPTTIAAPGWRYGCSSVRTGDTRPRGRQTRYIAQPWSANAGRLVVSDWLPRACGHDARTTDAACEGCANRITEILENE